MPGEATCALICVLTYALTYALISWSLGSQVVHEYCLAGNFDIDLLKLLYRQWPG